MLKCVPASRLLAAPGPQVQSAALAEVNSFVLDSAESRSNDRMMDQTNTDVKEKWKSLTILDMATAKSYWFKILIILYSRAPVCV